MAKSKKPIEIEIESKVVVLAFDEESARKKLAETFAAGRTLGPDVFATGEVHSYATTRHNLGSRPTPAQVAASLRRRIARGA